MIYKLIYSSIESYHLSYELMEDIAFKASIYNKTKNITGLLVYINGSIIQLLEGEKEDVLALFEDRISKDNRHKDIKIMMNGDSDARTFPEWNMGFKKIDNDHYSSYLQYNDYLEEIDPKILFSQNQPFNLLLDIIKYKDV